MMNDYDPLIQFYNWWMQYKPQRPPAGEVVNYDGRITENILYRDGDYQVELVIMSPNSRVPEHVHPEADSIEVYLSGDIVFSRNGQRFAPQNPGIDSIRIAPTDAHGGVFGDRGGTFYSIQHWQDGVSPDFISRNWEFSNKELEEKSSCLE